MHSILGILGNKVLMGAVIGWFLAQLLKVPTYYWVEKKLDWSRIRGSGGMPSSHTSFVFTLMLLTGFLNGFNTAEFAITLVLSCIVMYDATGVRRETGRQAVVINEILRNLIVEGKPIADDDLKELVGHKPLEVLGGVIVSLITTAIVLAV